VRQNKRRASETNFAGIERKRHLKAIKFRERTVKENSRPCIETEARGALVKLISLIAFALGLRTCRD